MSGRALKTVTKDWRSSLVYSCTVQPNAHSASSPPLESCLKSRPAQGNYTFGIGGIAKSRRAELIAYLQAASNSIAQQSEKALLLIGLAVLLLVYPLHCVPGVQVRLACDPTSLCHTRELDSVSTEYCEAPTCGLSRLCCKALAAVGTEGQNDARCQLAGARQRQHRLQLAVEQPCTHEPL